ncbi:MAG: hypothetical protein ACJ75S_06930 [Solirubrobacterales bacterium]|jgi:hypothetical protein
MGSWSDMAQETIQRVHASLPDDATLEQRKKAIDDAYPFGERKYSPYKTWLKARRSYLARYGHKSRSAPPESPMERMMRRAGGSNRA